MSQQPWLLEQDRLILYCHLQPGAKHNQLCGLHNHRLKIQIQAPAVDGKANKALINFLAKVFSTAKSKIAIVQGTSHRSKTVSIAGIEQIPQVLLQLKAE